MASMWCASSDDRCGDLLGPGAFVGEARAREWPGGGGRPEASGLGVARGPDGPACGRRVGAAAGAGAAAAPAGKERKFELLELHRHLQLFTSLPSHCDNESRSQEFISSSAST